MLIWLVLIPLIAAALIGLCKAPARPTALLSASLTLALGIWALVSFDGCSSCWSRFEGMDLQLTLAPALSKVMLLLTILVTFATVLGTNPPQGGEASWYNSALLISAGATGAFLSDNIISFFAFHELALIPTFVMIGLYGRGDRRTTAWRATLYLGLASMVLLAALLMIGTQAGFTFSGLKDFMASGRELAHAELIGALLIAGFGTLISLFPFHSWAAPAYASAPAPVAMMHAGVLKKFGLYGLFMFQPLMETGFLPWTNILLVLLVCNVIWVGYVTVNQKRLDLLLGNSSVMHMGYIFLAFAALVVSGSAEANPWALKGAALLMLAHGLTIALLFLLCGQIEKQLSGRTEHQAAAHGFRFRPSGHGFHRPPRPRQFPGGIHGLLLRFRRFQQRLRPRSNRHHPVPLGTGHRRGIHAEGLPQYFPGRFVQSLRLRHGTAALRTGGQLLPGHRPGGLRLLPHAGAPVFLLISSLPNTILV